MGLEWSWFSEGVHGVKVGVNVNLNGILRGLKKR